MEKETNLFRRIVVWFDPQAPESGAWGHALDWAMRLQRPLRVLATVNAYQSEHTFPGASACALRGVRWDLQPCSGPALSDVGRLLEPTDLFVFNHALNPTLRRDFLRRTFAQQGPAVLVCTAIGTPLTRMLLLDQGNPPSQTFLTRAIQLAGALGATPLVLTVARSERTARARQQYIRESLAGCRLNIDFDLVVGSEVRAAVVHVAYWRRSQLIVMERQSAPTWWRWLRGNTMERLIDGLDSLAFLSLPEASAFDSHLDPFHPALASEEATLLPASR